MDLITVTREEGLEFKLGVRGHQVTSDMSTREGGRDAGPSPAELLAGSLGACIAMIVQGYCDSHGYTDGDVGVTLTLELTNDPKRVSGIVINVELPKGIPEDKRDVVRGIAERCTIHETLTHPPQVDIDII
jgi:uncharacterized OsmC-like protein